uniref:Uncharacterized protein n=1 Tax=Glossina palpalis gambiensis TaxID=67801 RepID=A0A1B0C398_9MUSC
MTTTLKFNAQNPMNYFMSWLWKIFLLSHVILLMTALINIQIHYVTANAMGGNVATSANSANNVSNIIIIIFIYTPKGKILLKLPSYSHKICILTSVCLAVCNSGHYHYLVARENEREKDDNNNNNV